MPKYSEPGFEAVVVSDERGRLWKRVTRDEQGIVEFDLCTGPAGDDVGVALCAGEVLTPEVLQVVNEILGGDVAVIPIPSADELLAEGWKKLPPMRDDRPRFECPLGIFVVSLPPRTAEEARTVRAIVTSARDIRPEE